MFLALAPLRVLGDSPDKAGPHGGVLVGNESHQVELSLDSSHKKVDVYVLKSPDQPPESIGLTLLDANGNRRVFELKALEGPAQPTQYHGTLGPGEQSFIGFEVRIPFQSDPSAVFKSN